MTAILVSRDTKRLAVDGEGPAPMAFPCKAATALIQGTIGMLDASGRLVPGATATGQLCAGRIEAPFAAGTNDGDVIGRVKEGTYLWENSTSTDAIAATDAGKTCYIVDNQTVAKTSGTNTRSVAGIIRGVKSINGVLKVWVESSLEISRALNGV